MYCASIILLYTFIVCINAKYLKINSFRKYYGSVLIAASMLAPLTPLVACAYSDASSARFSVALKDLQELDANWDSKVAGDADNIRRVLGTVYTPPECKKALCGFDSFGRQYIKAHYGI
jgi:hypothetical protein